MQLVPQKNILLFTFLFVFVVLAFNNIGGDRSTEGVNDRNPTDNSSDFKEDVNGSVSFGDQSIQEDSELSGLNQRVILNIFVIPIAFMLFLIANISFTYLINSYDVIELVSTSLRLSKFKTTSGSINRLGRLWKIEGDALLELKGGREPVFHLEYYSSSTDVDPREFGLHMTSDLVISQKIKPEGLQLALQSFRRYLNKLENSNEVLN